MTLENKCSQNYSKIKVESYKHVKIYYIKDKLHSKY